MLLSGNVEALTLILFHILRTHIMYIYMPYIHVTVTKKLLQKNKKTLATQCLNYHITKTII